MKVPLPASSSLNFLAGIFAGAGINLVTSVAGGRNPNAAASTTKIFVDSALWVVAAAFLTWVAQVVQRGERNADADVARRNRLTDAEKDEVRDLHERQSWGHARLPIALTVVSLFVSVLFLPGLVHWSDLF